MAKMGPEQKGLRVTPSPEPGLQAVHSPPPAPLVHRRVVTISALAVVLGVVSGLVAQALMRLIGFITNLAF